MYRTLPRAKYAVKKYNKINKNECGIILWSQRQVVASVVEIIFASIIRRLKVVWQVCVYLVLRCKMSLAPDEAIRQKIL